MSDDYALGRLKGAHLTQRKSDYFFGLRGDHPALTAFAVNKRAQWMHSEYIVIDSTAGHFRKAEKITNPQLGADWPVIVVTAPRTNDVWGKFEPVVAESKPLEARAAMVVAMDDITARVIKNWLNEKHVRAARRVEALLAKELAQVEARWVEESESSHSRATAQQISQVEPAKLPVPQPPSDFIPSAGLVNFWRRGLEAHSAAARLNSRSERRIEFWETQTTEELARAFSLRIRRMFSVIGNRERYGIEDFKTVGSDRRFSLPVQYQILDSVQIRPDESSEFFSLLYDELAQYLSYGGRLAGSWGDLVLRYGRLELVSKPETLIEDRWDAAEVLEQN
jgi:hypothetical protein